MQQDCQLGIPPPSPCLAFLTLSLSLCNLSFCLSPSLSHATSFPIFYPGVTDYYSADGCSGECWEMTHNTSKLEQAGKHHLYSPPSLTQPKSHLSFSAQSFSLWLRSSTEAANSYNLNLKHTGAKSFPLLSLTTLADTNGMKLSALYVKSKFGAVTCSDSHCNVFLETQGISVTWCAAPWNMHPSWKSISTFPPSPSCTHLLQKTVSDSFLISVSYIYSISAPLRERPPLPLDKWGSCVCICVGSEPEQTGRGGLQHRVKTCNACSLVSSTEHHVYKLLKPLVINCKLKMSSFRKYFFHH